MCGLRSRHRAVLRRSQRRDRTSVLCFVPCTDREMGAQAEDSVLFKVRGATAATTWDVGYVSLLPRGALVYAPFAPVKLCVRRSRAGCATKAKLLTRASPQRRGCSRAPRPALLAALGPRGLQARGVEGRGYLRAAVASCSATPCPARAARVGFAAQLGAG